MRPKRKKKMTKMKTIEQLFQVQYGVNLELNTLSVCFPDDVNAVNFVSRTANNNGVTAVVAQLAGIEPLPAGTISVSAGGSVMEAFLQPKPYYSGRDLYYLTSLVPMSDMQKLFYCMCIRANKYRYNYGRQANKTLREILVPDLDDIPAWVNKTEMPSFSGIGNACIESTQKLDTSNWKPFFYEQLFEVKKGKRVTKLDLIPGLTPFLGAIDKNNGIRELTGLIPIHLPNTITVNYNGSVGEAFYQELEYWASDDINVLYPKFELNKYIAMFLITIIKLEKYRYNYGRKWHKTRMENSVIRLPVKENGQPDWELMEDYIKSIPYSASI